jgi:predicted permease
VLLAAMPMMGIYPTLAQAHGQDDWAAVALVVTTTSSFFTLTALMWWLLG